MSTTLEDGQQAPLFEHEKVVQSSRKQENNTSKPKHTYKKQEVIPTAFSIEQGASPTREDLQRYLWWSEGSQQNVRFTNQVKQAFQSRGAENKEVIISQFPYQVAQNILHYDYSNLENPNKEERGEILIPIEKKLI